MKDNQMKKRGQLLVAILAVLLIISVSLCWVHIDDGLGSDTLTGDAVKKFIISKSKFEQMQINAQQAETIKRSLEQQKTVNIYDAEGGLIATNPEDLEAVKKMGESFSLEIIPTQAASIQSVRIEGVSKDNLDKELVMLSDVPSNNTKFTDFDSVSSAKPVAQFGKMVLDYGYICAGPRYKIFKCKDWDYEKGICNNESSWVAIKMLGQGLHRVIITLSPEDPGIGIGPDPYATVCGDGFCEGAEGSEFCTNCPDDCKTCEVEVEKEYSWWDRIWNWMTEFFIGEEEAGPGPLTGEAVAHISQRLFAEQPDIQPQSLADTCVEDWQCGEWGGYSSEGYRHRACEDFNNCGTVKNKPLLDEKCQWMQEPVKKVNKVVKWFNVFIFMLISIPSLLFIAFIVRIYYKQFAESWFKHKRKKHIYMHKVLMRRLDELSQETAKAKEMEPIMDKLAVLLKRVLLLGLGIRRHMSFPEITLFLRQKETQFPPKKQAIRLVNDLERTRFATAKLRKRRMRSFISHVRALLRKIQRML